MQSRGGPRRGGYVHTESSTESAQHSHQAQAPARGAGGSCGHLGTSSRHLYRLRRLRGGSPRPTGVLDLQGSTLLSAYHPRGRGRGRRTEARTQPPTRCLCARLRAPTLVRACQIDQKSPQPPWTPSQTGECSRRFMRPASRCRYVRRGSVAGQIARPTRYGDRFVASRSAPCVTARVGSRTCRRSWRHGVRRRGSCSRRPTRGSGDR